MTGLLVLSVTRGAHDTGTSFDWTGPGTSRHWFQDPPGASPSSFSTGLDTPGSGLLPSGTSLDHPGAGLSETTDPTQALEQVGSAGEWTGRLVRTTQNQV